MKTWIIRHPNLNFERPLSQDELIQKIESGEIQAHDELCAGNGYWFSLSEADEVRKHLGDIRLQAMMPEESETTSSTRPALNAKTLITSAPKSQAASTTQAAPAPKPTPVLVPHSDVETNGVDWPKLIAFVLIFLGILVFLWNQNR